MKVIEQLILPRVDQEQGVDYGAPARVLVKRGGQMLTWQPGGSFWNGLTGTGYDPASLQVRGESRVGSRIHEGGRLSRKLLAQRAPEIDAVFGRGVAEKIDPKRTLILDAPDEV